MVFSELLISKNSLQLFLSFLKPQPGELAAKANWGRAAGEQRAEATRAKDRETCSNVTTTTYRPGGHLKHQGDPSVKYMTS